MSPVVITKVRQLGSHTSDSSDKTRTLKFVDEIQAIVDNYPIKSVKSIVKSIAK